jgi:type VII secretion protein EccB
MVHRLEHALVRWDTRMLHDPMKACSRATGIGVAICVFLGVGAAALAFLMPRAQLKDSEIVADKDTSALYVRINDVLHPVLNLASAQLIVDSPRKPAFVKPSELALLPRGPLVGIPGAPQRMPNPVDGSESHWVVCDTTSAAGNTVVTVVGAAPVLGDAVGPLSTGSAILARYRDETFLVYNGKRTPIDLQDKAVTLAVGIDSSAPAVLPMSRALRDAISETPPMVVPVIANAGAPSPWPLGRSVVIGSVIKMRPIDGGQDAFYVVLGDGVQKISAVTAAIIRNADPRNPPPPVEVAPNALLSIPVSRALNVDFYPNSPLRLIDPVGAPVTCLSWAQSRDESKARTTILSGHSLPLDKDAKPVSVVTADPNAGTADNVYIPPGTGELMQIAGGAPKAPTSESQWYIGDTGVRYGLVMSSDAKMDPPRSLGLMTAPLPAPWSIVSLLPAGPALSKADALMEHDSLPADPVPSSLPTRSPSVGG